MKPATKVVAGLCVDLDRRADLLGAAGVHHDHALGERHRLDLVVGDVEAGGAAGARCSFWISSAHLHAQLGVEVGQRLVEQEHRRLAHDRAAHRDALALAARELARLALQERLELEDLRRLVCTRVSISASGSRGSQAVRHVVEHAHVRIERVVLEHHRDVAVLRLEVVDHALADRDLAAR